ncbi:MAG TPA: hypothetical protein VHF89_15310 [Solirubrobacteraceae bacterium]|nr:hypothetical protein [Solirubrobacteraceae bacterium]
MASIPTQDQGQAREKAGEVAGQAQEKAQELAGQAGEQARQAAGQAKDQLRTQVDQRSTQVGEQVAGQADDVRTIAQQLREQGKDKPAQLAEQAADRAERVGSYLKESDADRILSDVEDFARRRPWAVVAGGLALGFAASRFLKASSSDRYYSRTPDQLPNTTTRPAGTTPAPTDTGRTGAPLLPTGNGHGVESAGPAPTAEGPPTSTGAL